MIFHRQNMLSCSAFVSIVYHSWTNISCELIFERYRLNSLPLLLIFSSIVFFFCFFVRCTFLGFELKRVNVLFLHLKWIENMKTGYDFFMKNIYVDATGSGVCLLPFALFEFRAFAIEWSVRCACMQLLSWGRTPHTVYASSNFNRYKTNLMS